MLRAISRTSSRPSPWARVVAAAAFMGLLTGCPKDAATPGAPNAAESASLFSATQEALNKRLAAIHDVDVEGTITDAAGQSLRFRYAMQQPSFTAGELLGADGTRVRAFIFDGKHLAIVDDATKTVVRQDLSVNEEEMLLTLHQVFSPFVCEGWRPPLLKPTGVTAVAVVDGTGGGSGDAVALTVPVGQGGVKHQRVVLGKGAAFASKQTVADDGRVLSETTVLESATDAATGLSFPVKWSMMEGGEKGTVVLSAWKVNAGIPAARFDTATPSGYTGRTP